MRTQLFKIASLAALMLALTSNAFAQESSGGGLRIGFYGALPAGNVNLFTAEYSGTVGLLFDLGNRLEIGLGIGYISYNETSENETTGQAKQTREVNYSGWEIIPSVAYTIAKGDVVSYGAGLNIYLSPGITRETKQTGRDTVKEEPDAMSVAFVPNFFLKAEVAKNFAVGLKTGLMIELPGKDVEDSNPNSVTTTTYSRIGFATELFLAFYL